MTNDFQLFPDSAPGEPAVDADAALITAYLARELSLVQIVAVEERLATDAAFRESVRPIIESWLVSGSFRSSAPRERTATTPTVTRGELDAGWQRYLMNGSDGNAHSLKLSSSPKASTTRSRRISMTRIAAAIALVVVPLLTFAGVVRYVAKKSDAPGHTIARRITETLSPSTSRPIGDEREGRELILLPGQQPVPVVDLPPATARTTRPMAAILGLKQTSDGRVLVNDALSRQVLLFERDLSTSIAVLDSVRGTSTTYGNEVPDPERAMTWRVLRPFAGDSAVFGPLPGMNQQTYLVLDSRGKVVRAFTVNTRLGFLSIGGNAAWDPQGRLVATEQSFPRLFVATRVTPLGQSSSTVPIRPDTLRVIRLADAATNRVDTVGTLLLPEDNPPRPAGAPFDLQRVGNGGGRHVPVTGPDGVVCWWVAPAGEPPNCINTVKQVVNPLYFVDDWAMLSDGTIAFVRGQDYHIDWIYPDGTKSSTGKLPFEWKKLTDADKQRVVDSTRSAIDSLDALADSIEVRLQPWKDSVTRAARAAGARMINTELQHPGPPSRIWPYEIVPLSQIADYYPPIRPAAAKADADGNLWILPRVTSLSKQGELVYDVVNPSRGLVQRVRLPAGRSIAGFGKGGVVYLQYGDLKTGFILERSTLPAAIPK